jgi:hypothetical protein
MRLRIEVIFWLVVVLAGVSLLIFSNYGRHTNSPISQSSPSLSPSPTATPTIKNTVVPSPSTQKTATCQLEGSIIFLKENLYETKGAKIIYQNVDSPARLLFWKTNPDDGALRIGPNIFSGLPLPDGEQPVGMTLEKTPTAKTYILTASITYGMQKLTGTEEIKEANCSGSITVLVP